MSKETKAPLIGDFSGPPNNEPRKSAPLQRKDAEPPEEVSDVAEEPKKEAPVDKATEYKKRLEELGLDLEDARKVLDAVLFGTGYSEKVVIGGKLPVYLRTRSYRDLQRTFRYLEAEESSMPMHLQDLVGRYNLAASLQSYGDTTFEFPVVSSGVTVKEVEDAFDVRLEFITSLPQVAVDRLITFLAAFDYKISAVFAEGAPEDF